MWLYLDNCAIQRPLDDRSQLRVQAEAEAVLGLLDRCQRGQLRLVSSGVHVLENQKSPHNDRRAHVQDVLALSRLYITRTPSMLKRAQGYVAAGIKQFDALHLASAVEASLVETGDLYFCTTDDKLLRKGNVVETRRVVVASPLELVILLDQTGLQP